MISLCKRIDFDTKCMKNIGQLVIGLFILDEKNVNSMLVKVGHPAFHLFILY